MELPFYAKPFAVRLREAAQRKRRYHADPEYWERRRKQNNEAQARYRERHRKGEVG